MASTTSEPRIIWHIEEYKHREKGADWFWALGIIAVLGAVIAVIYGNILFAVVIVLGGVMLGYYARREPEVIEIAISDEGINVRGYFYEFGKLKSFNVDEHHLGSHLLIETRRVIVPVTSIPLPSEGMDYEGLRELLRTKLPEKTAMTEKDSHRIMEHLGF